MGNYLIILGFGLFMAGCGEKEPDNAKWSVKEVGECETDYEVECGAE